MRRSVAALWMAVYALVAVAFPVVDATAGHAPVAMHWEDASDSSCPPRHDASTCQVCQAGHGIGRMADAGPTIPSDPRQSAATFRDPGTIPEASASQGSPPSRAPPRT